MPAKPDEPIALDGKTVLQIEVDEKTNEIPIALAVLPYLPVKGRVYTADARPTHLPFFQRIKTLGGDTVLVVKGNQPTLQEDLATYFADPLASNVRSYDH
jgi:hypothetical protein